MGLSFLVGEKIKAISQTRRKFPAQRRYLSKVLQAQQRGTGQRVPPELSLPAEPLHPPCLTAQTGAGKFLPVMGMFAETLGVQ